MDEVPKISDTVCSLVVRSPAAAIQNMHDCVSLRSTRRWWYEERANMLQVGWMRNARSATERWPAIV